MLLMFVYLYRILVAVTYKFGLNSLYPSDFQQEMNIRVIVYCKPQFKEVILQCYYHLNIEPIKFKNKVATMVLHKLALNSSPSYFRYGVLVAIWKIFSLINLSLSYSVASPKTDPSSVSYESLLLCCCFFP